LNLDPVLSSLRSVAQQTAEPPWPLPTAFFPQP
jgi:hypothetical protein